MAAKTIKKARIVYFKGNPASPHWWEGERFRFETWCPSEKCWGLVRQCAVVRSTMNPEAPEAEFVHWQFMQDVYRYAKDGYSLEWVDGDKLEAETK